MIKSPFTTTGKIRYYELLKLSFFVSFVYVVLSRLFKISPNIYQANIIVVLVFFVILVIESYLLIKNLILEIIKKIKAYAIKKLLPEYYFCTEYIQTNNVSYKSPYSFLRRFLVINVFRCWALSFILENHNKRKDNYKWIIQ